MARCVSCVCERPLYRVWKCMKAERTRLFSAAKAAYTRLVGARCSFCCFLASERPREDNLRVAPPVDFWRLLLFTLQCASAECVSQVVVRRVHPVLQLPTPDFRLLRPMISPLFVDSTARYCVAFFSHYSRHYPYQHHHTTPDRARGDVDVAVRAADDRFHDGGRWREVEGHSGGGKTTLARQALGSGTFHCCCCCCC